MSNGEDGVREKLIGLDERSVRKSYYPQLQDRLAELERFRALLDAVNDVIFLTDPATGYIIDVVGNVRDVLHCSKDDLKNKSLDTIMPGETAAQLQELYSVPDQVESLTLHTGLNCTGMSIVPVQLTAKVVKLDTTPYAVFVARDVTRQMRAEEALRSSEERYRTVADFNYDMECWLGPDGRMLYVSPACERITGYGPDMFIKDKNFLAGIIQPEDLPLWREHMDSFDENEEAVEFRAVRADGVTRWMSQVSRQVVGEDGRFLGVRFSVRDVTRRRRIERQLRHQALHDTLTGLPNRTLCQDRIGQAQGRARRREEYRFAVVFMDIVRFKNINDSLGHAAGDAFLREVASLLDELAGELDTVARYGGDEFVLVLEELTSKGQAVNIVRRIQTAMRKPFSIHGHEIRTDASFGLILDPPVDIEAEDIIRSANIAMHRAKESGRSRIKVFHKGMLDHAVKIMTMESDLRRAVQKGDFFLVYQPIVSLADFSLSGFEALVRWRHPDKGVISPAEFIPLAEETGIILDLGQFVLEEACRTMSTWSGLDGYKDLVMSVNLSTKQFSQQTLLQIVTNSLAQAGLRPERLKLEITESAIMDDPSRAIVVLKRLKDMGVALSVDDFGTGYSSMSYLQRFPLDFMKIDLSFVRNIHESHENFEIVKAIISLAHSLGMKTISEGVETHRHMDILRSLGSEYGQGYLFARPLEEEDARVLVAEPGRIRDIVS